MAKLHKMVKLGSMVALAFLLTVVSVSSVSATVEIAIASPPLENLVVTPGQEFSVNIRVYNNGDGVFVAHLEATEDLPVTFAKNDFELTAGTSSQVKTTFGIPDGWQLGEIHNGDISVKALLPEGTSGSSTSAQILGSLSKHVSLKVGDEPDVPAEPQDNDNLPPEDDDTEDEGDETPPVGSGNLNPLEIAAAVMVGIACVVVIIIPLLKKKRGGNTDVAQ